MYVRCADCHDYSRVALDGPWDRVHCPGCSRKLNLNRVSKLGASPKDRFERTYEYCRGERIDLASAYSVLLGLMSLSDARSLMQHGRRGVNPRHYDRGFRRAVQNGRLTLDRARARGDRIIYGSRLVHEHSLSMYDAFRVADNELSLKIALSGEVPPQQPVAGVAPSERRLPLGLSVCVAVTLLLGGALFIANGEDEPVAGSSPTRSGVPARAAANGLIQAVQKSTEVRANAQGMPTRIVGPSPDAVLEAYCQTQPGLPQAVRTIHDENEATAVFRRDGRLYSLQMVLDQRDGRWSVGDGENPIATLASSRGD